MPSRKNTNDGVKDNTDTVTVKPDGVTVNKDEVPVKPYGQTVNTYRVTGNKDGVTDKKNKEL